MQTTHGVQTSNRLFEIVEDGMVFKPQSGHGQYGRLELEFLSSDMDGVFPRQSEWTKFSNKVDNDGGSYLLSYYLRGSKKLKGDIGYCTIERQSLYGDECTLTFKKPIKMSVGGFRNKAGEWEHVVEEIDYLVGDVTYEWFWSRNSKNERAQYIEIYLDIKDFGKLSSESTTVSSTSTVWFLEQFDVWFSSDSRISFGVFTSREKAIESMFKNYSKEAIGKDAEFYENGTNQWVSDELSCGMMIREVELDKFEEL